AFDGSAVALIVDQERRRHLVPVPRLVRGVLEVALDLSGGDVDRDGRRDVEVISRPLIAHPRTAVPRYPVRDVRLRIVVAGDPHGGAAGPPLIAFRPCLAAGFAR